MRTIYTYSWGVKVKNIPKSSLLYTRRAILWQKDSSPFLSGDAFAKLSDVSVFPPYFRGSKPSRREIAAASIIFCPSHRLEDLLADYGNIVNAKVLILGNSDRDFVSPIENLPRSIKKVFCQNLAFKDPRYHVLPIGIENLRLATNGDTKLFSREFFGEEKSEKVLLGPFSKTHVERDEFLFSDFTDDKAVILNDRLKPCSYAQLSSTFRYIAAPRGNGLDTHRFWETLYRGGIPIVKQSAWSTQIQELGIPLLAVNSWSASDVMETLHAADKSKSVQLELPQLWMNWWERLIRNEI
jgi:hypothetical protein